MAALVCKGCGRQLLDTDTVCPECNTAVHSGPELSPMAAWEKEFKQVRLHWIISVIIFWVTLAVTLGLYLIHGSAYINELGFLALFFMVMGVYLKTRVLYTQRKKPKT